MTCGLPWQLKFKSEFEWKPKTCEQSKFWWKNERLNDSFLSHSSLSLSVYIYICLFVYLFVCLTERKATPIKELTRCKRRMKFFFCEKHFDQNIGCPLSFVAFCLFLLLVCDQSLQSFNPFNLSIPPILLRLLSDSTEQERRIDPMMFALSQWHFLFTLFHRMSLF